jgi:hypothetical protein
MADTFKIKRNDTKPYLAVRIQKDDGTDVDLTTGSYIYFNLATNDNNFTPLLSGTCVVTGSTTGQCEYRWATGDTNRSGTFLGEFEVTFSGPTGGVLTVPPDHSLFVKIFEDYD